MIKPPSIIRAGPYDIKITFMEDKEAYAHGIYGHFSQSELTIRVNKALDPMVLLDTINHEIMHVCFFIGNLDDKDDEEKIVTVMSTIWTQIERDNPKLIAFKQAALKDHKPGKAK